jgi:hypothetical protein
MQIWKIHDRELSSHVEHIIGGFPNKAYFSDACEMRIQVVMLEMTVILTNLYSLIGQGKEFHVTGDFITRHRIKIPAGHPDHMFELKKTLHTVMMEKHGWSSHEMRMWNACNGLHITQK